MNNYINELENILNAKNKSNDEYKMVIAVRRDLKLPKGKLAAQVAHAAVECAIKSKRYDPDTFEKWYNSGQKKAVVYAEDEDAIWKIKEKCERNGIISSIIFDAGRTVTKAGTLTCVGLGPAKEDEIDKITGDLKLI